MFEKNKANKWKCEYEDTVYKIYDWGNRLTGYFFPRYNISTENDIEIEDIILRMIDAKDIVDGGHIMLPMLKLNILDREYLKIEETISELEKSCQRAIKWKNWIEDNRNRFNIVGDNVSTSREDRNMLAVILEINYKIMLNEKYLLLRLLPY